MWKSFSCEWIAAVCVVLTFGREQKKGGREAEEESVTQFFQGTGVKDCAVGWRGGSKGGRAAEDQQRRQVTC